MYSKQHMRPQRETVSLASHPTAPRLQWLGHVLRMGEEHYPRQACFSYARCWRSTVGGTDYELCNMCRKGPAGSGTANANA
jgi:hypothetical protein